MLMLVFILVFLMGLAVQEERTHSSFANNIKMYNDCVEGYNELAFPTNESVEWIAQ